MMNGPKRRATFIVFAAIVAIAAKAPAGSPPQTQEHAMTKEDVVKAVHAHDWKILNAADLPAPPIAELTQELPTLDGEARELVASYLGRRGGRGSGAILLRLSGDPDTAVASAAATGVAEGSDRPSVADVLAAIPQRDDPFVRGKLYRAVGASRDAKALDPLRALATIEKDVEAAHQAQIAAVRLHGKPERTAFLARIRGAQPDQAMDIHEQLLYVADPQLAVGVIPWLSNEAGVIRLGSDRQASMVRMCDLAVWTAHLLGVKFTIQPEYLTNYEPSVIAAASTALRAL